jgi:hypothetical protein
MSLLSALENRVLRRIIGPRKEEVKEDWRNQHNEEFHILYSLPYIIGLIRDHGG